MSGFQDLSDVQLVVIKEEFIPEEQEGSSSPDQKDPPEPAHIKEEQEELWISQDRQPLKEAEEADIKVFTFTPVPVKSEVGDEAKTQSDENRDTEHLKTEADGEDCGVSDADRDFSSDINLQAVTSDKTSHVSGSDTDDSADWEESDEPQGGLNPEQNKDVALNDNTCKTEGTPVSTSKRAPTLDEKKQVQKLKGTPTGDERWSCSVCHKKFSKKGNLKQHMTVHAAEKQFSCSICEKKFSQERYLKQHLTVHTGEQPFSCSFCGKGFCHPTHLRQHLTVHTGEKPFSCTVCGKSFSRQGHLKQHLTVHTGGKQFSCSVCEKKFSQERYLKQHMTIHTGEQPFSCSVCGKKFFNQGHLKDHMSVHTGEKPFSCSVCSKSFSRSGQLKDHMTVHTEGKQFSCPLCHQRFSYKRYLKQHLTIHNGAKPFSCSFCGKSFSRQGQLKEHLNLHEGENLGMGDLA